MNKNVKEFSPSLLAPKEIIGFACSAGSVITRNVQGDSFVDTEIAEMNIGVQNLESALHVKKDTVLGDDLVKKNKDRSTSVRSLVSYLVGMTGVEIKPDLKNAATYLLSIIQKQGKRVDRLGYTEKTGAISVILDSFKQPEAVAHINTLNIGYMIDHLASSQEAFATAYQAKVKADAKQTGTFVAKTETGEVCYHITKLLNYIDAKAQKEPAFGTVVSELNTVICDIMSKAHSRKTRSKAAPVSTAPTSPLPVVPAITVQAKAA